MVKAILLFKKKRICLHLNMSIHGGVFANIKNVFFNINIDMGT